MKLAAMRLALIIATTFVLGLSTIEAACAASCSSWRAICVRRASAGNASYLPQCDAKFRECLSSGCFTEGPKFGGATHCELVRK